MIAFSTAAPLAGEAGEQNHPPYPWNTLSLTHHHRGASSYGILHPSHLTPLPVYPRAALKERARRYPPHLQRAITYQQRDAPSIGTVDVKARWEDDDVEHGVARS
jgi:hypothetical protein